MHGTAAISKSGKQGHSQQQQQQPEATDIFVTYFEAALEEELKEQSISRYFRLCCQKISSPYGFIRKEGLREALQCLCDLSFEAAVEAGGGIGTTPHLPYDAVRAAVIPRVAADPHGASPAAAGASCRSESWERTQSALRNSNHTTSVFHRVLVSHANERTRYNFVGPINIKLTEAAALNWCTLFHGQPQTGPPPTSAEERKPLDVKLTEVTYQEQELALRLLQGLSLVVYDQRRLISEGLLIPYAIELWQCCLQHITACFNLRRRQFASEHQGDTTSRPLDDGAVQLVSGLETVVIASIDAVEAVCHYNPHALTRIVQQSGVSSLLNLGFCPYAPYDIRCSVFDTISVLMQEVAPFRRAVVGNNNNNSNSNSGGGAKKGGGEELLQTMVQQAMAGILNQPSTPPPFLMDRASASKFDSAVREWFSEQGLSHVVSAVMELRDVRGTPIAAGAMPKAEVARIVQRASQLREKRLQALLQVIDGRRIAL